MKTQKVYMRIASVISVTVDERPGCGSITTRNTWYCIEYPPFTSLTDLELGVLRAKSMLALHQASNRVFYIEPHPSRRYISIKTDGVFEFPEPRELTSMTSYTPEDLCSFLKLTPLETLDGN